MDWGDGTLEVRRKPRPPAEGSAEHLFRVLECDRPTAAPSRHLLAGLDSVAIGRAAESSAERLATSDAAALQLHIPDPWMSKAHAALERAADHWILRDLRSTNGTLVNGAAVDRWVLSDGDLVEMGHTFFIFRERMAAAAGPPDRVETGDGPLPGLCSLLPSLQARFDELARIAASAAPLVIQGETGTGKELIARAAHALSRRPGRFVAVNCAALPANLVESELFGHRKGAFSGASEDRPGLIRSAHQGTLFLDEAADLPLPAQAALLRVLQEREVVPVGDTRPVPVDLRAIAASQESLEGLVERGRFRADFQARLTGFAFSLPRLSERREDLGLIVGSLLRRAGGARAAGATFAGDAARALFRHGWPLNVRELEKCVETALVLACGGPIELSHLPEALRRSAPPSRPSPAQPSPRSAAEEKRKDELLGLLRAHGGNVTAVSRAMGKARVQIQRWIKRYQLDPKAFRD